MTGSARTRLSCLGLALALVATGCSSGSGDSKQAGGSWTVLHYSVADNNLEEPMSADVNELGEVGSTGDLTVREYLDRSPGYGEDDVLDQGDWVGARVFDLGADGTTELVEDLGDVDSSDPATLADFVTAGITDHPADHYALSLPRHAAMQPSAARRHGAGREPLRERVERSHNAKARGGLRHAAPLSLLLGRRLRGGGL